MREKTSPSRAACIFCIQLLTKYAIFTFFGFFSVFLRLTSNKEKNGEHSMKDNLPELLSPKVDIIFKLLFGDERNKDLTINLGIIYNLSQGKKPILNSL